MDLCVVLKDKTDLWCKKSLNSDCAERWILTGKEHERIFWDDAMLIS